MLRQILRALLGPVKVEGVRCRAGVAGGKRVVQIMLTDAAGVPVTAATVSAEHALEISSQLVELAHGRF